MSTYTPIASITLASTATSVTFSGIPQAYTDLVLVANTIIASGTGNDVALRFNGDSGSNYSNTYMLGTGSTTVSGWNALTYSDNGYLNGNSGEPNTRIINIQNYSNTTTFKTNISRASGMNGVQSTAYVNTWRSTAAITSIQVYSAFSLTYAIGTTFNLYGIANAGITNVAKATGGDIVTTDGTYWYHGFLSSGVFAPTQALNADVLVVAGGAAGSGGGGGAGGVLLHSSQSLAISNYAITVGAGGTSGLAGSNSQFASLTASIGGGAGGGYNEGSNNLVAGGSGGGGGAKWNTSLFNQAGGAATSGQGNAGGTGLSQGPVGVSNVNGGGGGGAGGTGGNATTGVGGAGGAGTSAYSTWLSATGLGVSGFIAGGGGGGSYANGGAAGSGGASAGTTTSAQNAIANTGSGAGGGYAGGGGAAQGGSGLVIVRYAV